MQLGMLTGMEHLSLPQSLVARLHVPPMPIRLTKVLRLAYMLQRVHFFVYGRVTVMPPRLLVLLSPYHGQLASFWLPRGLVDVPLPLHWTRPMPMPVWQREL